LPISLRESRGYYEFRVVDIGPDFNMPIHWAALSNVDTVLLVVTPERTALSDVRNILRRWKKSLGTLQRFRIVLNGFDEALGLRRRMSLNTSAASACRATLPWDPNAAASPSTRAAVDVTEAPHELGEGLIKLRRRFYPPLETLLRKRPVKKGGLSAGLKTPL
jgi:MinD-like ATPase involved in chromosome partitioning or flagellar assembly